MPEVVTIELESRTVFWKDLGLTPADLFFLRYDDGAANKLLAPVNEWLEHNIKGTYRLYAEGIWFFQKKDAALFKLFWSGGALKQGHP